MISREHAKEVLEDLVNNEVLKSVLLRTDIEAMKCAISALSENKGEDRTKGHWIESGYVGNDNYLFECSECHHTDTQSKAVKVNYCWHCGADMRGE